MKLNRLVALVVALCLMLGCTAIAEQFPLVDEPTTLHIMAQVGSYYPDQKLDNVHGLQKYEEMSGVHIEWDNVSNSVFGDTLAARIADSGTKLPDIILRGKIGNDKLASWGEQGISLTCVPTSRRMRPTSGSFSTRNPPSPAPSSAPTAKSGVCPRSSWALKCAPPPSCG